MPPFLDLVFHENFEEHQALAGRRVVTREEVLEVWDGRRQLVPNRKSRSGQYLMVGYTNAGRAVTVALFELRPAGTWLAHTAWDTKPSDR